MTDDALERLVEAVRGSGRYREVCPAVIRRIGAVEIRKRRSWKEAEKETRNRLHQIGGAYLVAPPPYRKWLDSLRSQPDAEAWRAELRRMMLCHASTRERLPFLDAFYARTLADIRPVRSVLDLACGFNPLALPWIGLEAGVRYEAYDLYSDMMAFLGEALHSSPFAPSCSLLAEARDVAADPPSNEVDVAFILKFLPLLEQGEKGSTLSWLQSLHSRHLLVSFPTRTLGGRNVGMTASYEGHFKEICEQAGWQAQRFAFENELCFLVSTSR